MRFTSIFAAAIVLNCVDAVELHSHQKSAMGSHIRRASPHREYLAQQKSKKINWKKAGDKLKKAGNWAKSKGAEIKSNVADLKDSYNEGGLVAALDTAAGQASEAIDDTTDAVNWTKQAGADIKDEFG